MCGRRIGGPGTIQRWVGVEGEKAPLQRLVGTRADGKPVERPVGRNGLGWPQLPESVLGRAGPDWSPLTSSRLTVLCCTNQCPYGYV